MSEFIEECRREWQRLGVPDPIANEMAADLAADLDEADAEGASPEDVLGNSAFDPRSFAAAWAVARGVTSPVPVPARRSLWRPPVVAAMAVVLGALVVGAGLLLALGHGSRSIGFAGRKIFAGPGPVQPVPGTRIVIPSPLRPFVGPRGVVFDGNHLALLVLAFGFFALFALVMIALWRWSPLFAGRRGGRRGPGPTPGWN